MRGRFAGGFATSCLFQPRSWRRSLPVSVSVSVYRSRIAFRPKVLIGRPSRRALSGGGGKKLPKVAVLYQAVEPPVINGVTKPKKPGGYKDSGADIAYVLRSKGIPIITPSSSPKPNEQDGWCFPDTESGILSAIKRGATHLWANTLLFSTHPLQSSQALDEYASQVKVVGQPPQLVEQYDDKNFVNSLLRDDGSFPLPRSWIVDSSSEVHFFSQIPYPIVGKPIRGRGSHGVKVCDSPSELSDHVSQLLSESPRVMLEEYLSGTEGTITVMPPSRAVPRYWSMPIVLRFNHQAGVAPYNGVVAVTANSRVTTTPEEESTIFREISSQCERVAEKLKVTAPIRIDIRQFSQTDLDSPFAIFDVNMKPNMTGPGRPGREDQASLTAMAASKLGWDYPELLLRILESAQTLETLRKLRI